MVYSLILCSPFVLKDAKHIHISVFAQSWNSESKQKQKTGLKKCHNPHLVCIFDTEDELVVFENCIVIKMNSEAIIDVYW